MTQFPLYLSRYLLLMAMLCYVQFSMAQSILGFPTILDNSPPMAGTQATHDTLRWDDFVNYENHSLYGPIGKAIGQLVVSYEGIDIPFPCTATLIAENILLTNYHCVYPSKKDAYGNTHRITSARIYMDYNQPDSGRSGLRSFAVSTIPIDYSEEPDFAILSTIDTIPFETYGLKNIKIGNYRDSNSLFLIHHSSEDLASDHKRLTNRDCVAMDFSRIGTTQIALPDGETGRAAIAGHDVPHFCDTKGGASGSLIFNNRGEIVGLNFAGLRNYDRRTKRFLPEDNRFNLFVDIQALLQASDTLSEILFGIEKQGSLSIDSTPSGATVVLEGQAIGTTPLRNIAYRIGDYQLRLSYSGYETHSESISIAAEQHVQRNITLRAEAPQQGYLSVTSSPSGASVSVDGRVIGTTPLSNRAYDVGNYQLSLRYNGYQSYSEDINIRAGQNLQRNITLRANQPELIRTVDELVRRARQGGTLRLAAGTFRLSSTLELSGDVRLVGQGYEQTRIVSSAGEYVVRYAGGGTFAAQGVGFEHTGDQRATVMQVDDGTLDIDSCQFTGGKRVGNPIGSGLWIKGDTRGTVRNSLFNDNDLHGIQVDGNAQPRLEQNRLYDNTQLGIAYNDSAGGSAVSNESFGNGLYGIGVKDNAQPRLEQNRLHDNTKSGIAYAGSAGGSAVSNESYGNGYHGIGLKDNAQPRLENNEVYDNKYHGIQVAGNAQPRLEQNRLHDNTRSGITYFDSAGGSAVGNDSFGNGTHGIYVGYNAQPRLEQNRLHDNTYAGIVYRDSAGGSANNNQIYNNRWGIYVYETATPTLNNNTTYGNQDGGIVDLR